MIKNDYPRPQLRRESWQNLNGKWRFAFDNHDKGIKEKWYEKAEKYNLSVQVPFVYQCKRSEIFDNTPHDIVWYYREFETNYEDGQTIILHFGAVDYETDVYVNGQHVCHHIGGHTSFEVDITNFLKKGDTQTLSVRAYDSYADESIPRGKQFWDGESRSIWYTGSTGIWQTVWLEVLEKQYIKTVRYTPLFDEGKIAIEVLISDKMKEGRLSYDITFKNAKVAAGCLEILSNKINFTVDLFQEHIFRTNYHDDGWSWTPESPNVFDVEFVVKQDNTILDRIASYFGMRKVHAEKGVFYLNNKPYYQKLVLDQGYWPEGLLTAPTDEDFVKDIKLAKEMGFNGCRKHQKTEDPRFLYWADQLGFLVWGECAAPAIFNNDAVERSLNEWSEILQRDYNHPSIVVWVPINESWGVPNISFERQQQHFSQTMYHYIHTIDKTRLVISNDGWAATETDIVAIHNYAHGGKEEIKKYKNFKDSVSTRDKLLDYNTTPWPIFAKGFEYDDQPILLTEFGGIAFKVSKDPGWGYTSVNSEKEFIEEYKRLIDAVYESTGLWGFCYTQITDVEQEINGLLTYHREPKCSLEEIRIINETFHVSRVE